MGTQVAIRKRVPKGSNLARKEALLLEAMNNWGESFYKMGDVLQSIYADQVWKDGGYTNFDDYMKERQPCGIGRTQGWRLIAASKVRSLLPTFGDSPNGRVWTERSIRPLTHRDFHESDVRRLGKKIATRVKKGDKLTAELVKEICDLDRGVPKRKKREKDKEVRLADTPAEALRDMQKTTDLWLSSLGKVPATFWEDAVADDSGCVKEFISSLSELASFLPPGE